MKGHMLAVVSVAATALLLAACSSMGAKSSDSASNISNGTSKLIVASDFPVGRYQEGTTVVVFNPDGTFLGTTPDGNDWVRGTYTHTANEITLIDTWESEEMVRNGTNCKGIPGRYSWVLSGQTLTATVIDDTCEGRKQGTDGIAWTRMH